jgi:diguanylate cyclase (GGDEF)-like protein
VRVLPPESGIVRAGVGALRSGLRAGAALLAGLVFVGWVVAGQTSQTDQRLRDADAIKSSNYPEYVVQLNAIEAAKDQLTPAQLQYFHYLRAWERGYAGDYDAAIPLYKSVIADSADAVLRFRATASLVSNLSIARRYLEAYTHLDLLIEQMPNTTDLLAREQGLHAAALLNNQAGQYELGLNFATRLQQERVGLRGECIARELRVESLYKLKKLEADGEEIQLALDVCGRHREVVFANIVRSFQAHQLVDEARHKEAITLLARYYDEVQKTRYLRVISEVDILLAEAYWHLGDMNNARTYALRAIDKRVPNEVTESLVGAYRLLYRIAERQGDTKTALSFHEKYADADRQNFDDVSARSLAYQMARHQSIANKLQIDALNKQNEVLKLQQDLGAKAAETSRLYIAMLLAGLLVVFLWAFYTKRRQLHFRTLSQRDGLTQIANRPHFLTLSSQALAECRRNGQEAAAILFDLDHFKIINDRHGHAAGDQVLRKVAAACATYLRPNQPFGRIGGEEFAVLLVGCGEEEALRLAEQLRRAVAGANADGSLCDFAVSASFGVTSTRRGGYELNHLLACADVALYRAKLRGRDRVASYDGSQTTRQVSDAERSGGEAFGATRS